MYIIIACSKNIFIKNLNVVSYCYINYYTGKCSKVSLKAFTLNNQWSFGVDPKYPLVDLTNIYTHNIKIFLPSEIVENLWVEEEIIFL